MWLNIQNMIYSVHHCLSCKLVSVNVCDVIVITCQFGLDRNKCIIKEYILPHFAVVVFILQIAWKYNLVLLSCTSNHTMIKNVMHHPSVFITALPAQPTYIQLQHTVLQLMLMYRFKYVYYFMLSTTACYALLAIYEPPSCCWLYNNCIAATSYE